MSRCDGGASPLLAELEPLWTAYATVSGEHSGWQEAAVYLRESKRVRQHRAAGVAVEGLGQETERSWRPSCSTGLVAMPPGGSGSGSSRAGASARACAPHPAARSPTSGGGT